VKYDVSGVWNGPIVYSSFRSGGVPCEQAFDRRIGRSCRIALRHTYLTARGLSWSSSISRKETSPPVHATGVQNALALHGCISPPASISWETWRFESCVFARESPIGGRLSKRFVADSSVEEDGLELAVPPRRNRLWGATPPNESSLNMRGLFL
jgi:hypothetical protein